MLGILRPPAYGLLDNLHLVFHEAGHVLLSWGGETLMLLGGSLMQLLVPLSCVIYFYLRRESYAAGILTLWLAHSLSNVAVYVGDAKDRQLDLMTGDPDTHDWWQLFSAWGMLDSAQTIGKLLQVLAVALVLVGVLLALQEELQGTESDDLRR